MANLRQFVAENIYAKFFRSPHWRVGWRRLVGPDLWDTQSLQKTSWHLLPDPRIRFLADPIAIEHAGRTVLFVEDFHHDLQKGVISAVEFDAEGPIAPAVCVLEEPWHLSYPFVLEAEGNVSMMPESSANREVALYRADPFPSRWVKEAPLLRDLPATDATVFARETAIGFSRRSRTCLTPHRICISSLHPAYLVPGMPTEAIPCCVIRARAVRGSNHKSERSPVETSTDCSRRYGAALGLAEITRLDVGGYEQVVRNVLAPCPEWPGRRLHTLSQAGGLEFIDGSANVLRWSRGAQQP